MSLQDLQNGEEFLDQMLSGLQAGLPWPDMSIATATGDLFDDQSAFLTTKLRQHQINTGDSDVKSLLLQQQLLLSRGLLGADDSGVFGNEIVDHSAFKSNGSGSIQGVFNGFTGSLQSNQNQNFQYPPLQAQNFGSPGPVTAPISQGPTTVAANSAGGGGSGPPAQPRQRVRARRGQATDPHSIAERLRRERIAERMKSLQELVPNANKTDKASMLDEIIDYVKFLQLQVKVLSMSRMGGVAAVAPLVADISTEGGPDGVQAASGGVAGRSSNATPLSSTNNTMTVAENQVVKLMEEDMGLAMQYLQGKGLCLMPISLATAISTATATCHLSSARNNPSSPNLSAVSVKDSTSVSKS